MQTELMQMHTIITVKKNTKSKCLTAALLTVNINLRGTHAFFTRTLMPNTYLNKGFGRHA